MSKPTTDPWRADILRRVGDMQLAVTRIENAVLGDEKAGQDGLVKRVKKIEATVQAFKNKYLVGMGIGGTLTVIYSTIKDWLFVHLHL